MYIKFSEFSVCDCLKEILIRFKGISYCPKPMAVTPHPIPKITNGLVFGAGAEIGIGVGFRARPVITHSALSSMATPSTLSSALLPSRNNLVFLKGGLTRRRAARFEAAGVSTRLSHLRIYGSTFRVAAAASSAEEQPSSSGVSICKEIEICISGRC